MIELASKKRLTSHTSSARSGCQSCFTTPTTICDTITARATNEAKTATVVVVDGSSGSCSLLPPGRYHVVSCLATVGEVVEECHHDGAKGGRESMVYFTYD